MFKLIRSSDFGLGASAAAAQALLQLIERKL